MNIDPRGPRFAAAITTVVLAIVLITGSGWLLFAQTLVFAIGALAGLRYAPYGLLYRYLVRRLNVLSTPTVLVLTADGSIARRASGLPRKSDVLAAVGGVLQDGE